MTIQNNYMNIIMGTYYLNSKTSQLYSVCGVAGWGSTCYLTRKLLSTPKLKISISVIFIASSQSLWKAGIIVAILQTGIKTRKPVCLRSTKK